MKRHSSAAALVALLPSLFLPPAAQASIWGEENASLGTIVSQMATQISQGIQQLVQLKETYDQTRKYVGYAQDAVNAFRDFQSFGEEVLQRPGSLADQLFPDLQAIRREASGTGPWAEGTGELQRVLRQCLATGQATRCVELQDAVTLKQARRALEGTFGTVAAADLEVNAVDYEASVAMASASAMQGRAVLTREQSKALLGRCTQASGDGAAAACQAAAHAAAIEQLQQLSGLSDALAQANRLGAVQLAQHNAQRKRELNEALQRRDAVREGSRRLAPPKLQLRTAGLDFFDGDAR